MPKAKLRAAALGGSADDVEAAFYEALQDGDLSRLMACWSDDDEVVCVHPGSPRLVGLAAIQASFESLFSNGQLRAHPRCVRKVEALACAVHSVLERVELLTPEGLREVYVVATNVYHKTPQGWRLVLHHASPGTLDDVQEVAVEPSSVLH